MKKIYIILACLFILALQLKAQAPNSFSYQGVARNASGLVLPNQAIGLRFTIHQGSAGGTVVYQETQAATTNLLGLFTVSIGSGTPVTGTFATIAWAANTEFLQVEMDPTGGTSYLDMGTNQFLSVPYALSSGSGWNLTGNSSTNGTDYVGTTDANDLIFKAHNNEVMRIANTTKNVGIGNPTPDASAALDVTSSTQGLLMPRMATNPANPAQGLMYFNTTTGCFMFYTGSTWNAMVCPCPNTPLTPGAISGPSSGICLNATGVVYSVAPVSNAISYTWTVPTGATITAGQGSYVITVTMGSNSGSVGVAGVNNCATGAPSTLPITLVTSPISVQPVNAAACASGNATFSVTASGSPTYQWQVSTNGGTSYANVVNNATYTGATSGTLTLTSPPVGMNGYMYQCILVTSSGCSFTSTSATLSVGSGSVPITITNGVASSTTSTGLQVMVTVNSSSYTGNGEDANLDNVEFSTGPLGSGTILKAWMESASANPPTSSSTATVYWVNLGSTTITNGTPIKIYMTFTSSPVMTSNSSVTGEASNISSIYGQYDNGALVFPNVYTAWGGLSGGTLPTGISKIGSETITNNATSTTMTLTAASGVNGVYYTTTPASAQNATVMETYTDIYGGYLWWGTTNGTQDGNVAGSIVVALDYGASSTHYIYKSDALYTPMTAAVAAISTTPLIWSISLISNTSLAGIYANYTQTIAANGALSNSVANPVYYGFFGTTQNPGLGSSYCTIYWTRTRVLPPSGTLPTISFGTFGCM